MPAPPTWPALIGDLLAGRDLTIAESTWAMQQVMDGLAPSAALAGFLVALRAKGETVDEIVGFRDAVLARAVPLPVDPTALDIVGTGGERRALRARSAGGPARRARRQGPVEDGHHLRLRLGVPSRVPARRRGPRRARGADGVQLPGPAVQPGA